MNQFRRTTGPLFIDNGTRINPESTAADLFKAVFYAPQANDADIREQVMGVVDDDLDLLVYAMQGSDDADIELWQRVVMRVQTRIKLADELRKRFAAAEADAEEDGEKDEPQMLPGEKRIYVVPMGNDGKPDFESARSPDPETMANFGWVSRCAAITAINVMLGGANSAAAIAQATIDPGIGEPESTPHPSGVYAPETTEAVKVEAAE
jgi:hypothetical protein